MPSIKRTDVSIEVEKVLSDLYPLLRTVQPAQINATLNALSTALEGRGEQIGENLVTVDGYLKRLNPQIPGLVEDLRLTAQVSDTYSQVLPEVGQILRNTVKTTGTLEGREAKLKALFNDVAAFSDTTKGFLDDNGDNLIRLSQVSAQQLAVLAKYSPEYPCLTRRHRERREAPGRGVPQLHAAHRARDAAEPAPRLQPERPAAARRQAGPELPDPAQRGGVAGQPHAARPELQRRRRRAHGQGHRAGSPRRTTASTAPAARRSPPCSSPCSAPASG